LNSQPTEITLKHPSASDFDGDGNYIWDKNGFLVTKGTGNGMPANNYQDNYRGFFRDAIQSLNNLSLSGGTEKATYFFSTSYLTNEGIVPNEEYGRKTFRLAGTLKASDKLSLQTTLISLVLIIKEFSKVLIPLDYF
jgi:hypothetical protein